MSGLELVCGWSRDHKKPRYDIRLMTSHFFRNVSFAGLPYIMANTTLKMTKSNYEKSWSGTTRTINFGPHYMWSMPLDRCSPAFSVRDKNFQKVTNWSALVPEISSEQRDLWPFGLLDVVWMQWIDWSGISLWVVQGPQKAEIWH